MKVLIMSPHGDDGALGAGGTIAKRINEGHEVYHCVITGAVTPTCDEETMRKVKGEVYAADRYLGIRETFFLDFPAVMLETVPRYTFNGKIMEVVRRIEPDEVYIPHRGDMQLDHKLVVDAAMVALRPKYSHKVKRIYAYETMSETNWDIPNIQNEFIPTVYEDISKTLENKLTAMGMFQMQLQSFPNGRSLEALEALARYRGAIVGVNAAEAFVLIREIKLDE